MNKKELIEKELTERLRDCLETYDQDDAFVSLVYDESTQTCMIKMNVHIVEEDNYIGFSVY